MHASIEQLIQLRDHVLPADTPPAKHLENCHGCRRKLAELTRLRRNLQALPGLEAPVDAWRGIANRIRPRRNRKHHALAWSLAASLLIGSGLAAWIQQHPSKAPIDGDQRQTLALMRQSQILDQALDALAPDYRVMRGRTASTVARLEDSVAALDYQINLLGIQNHQPTTREKDLWRQRVDLMRSLYTVQYTQARYRVDHDPFERLQP